MSDGFDLTGIDPENLENRLTPGKYQVLVQSHEEDDKKRTVAMEIVAAKDPSQLGKIHNEKLFKSQKSAGRSLKFLMACGAVTKEELIAAKARGDTAFAPDWSKSHGRGLFVEIEKSGQYTQVTYMGFYGPNDPEVQDFPRNDAALQAAKDKNDQGNAGIKF